MDIFNHKKVAELQLEIERLKDQLYRKRCEDAPEPFERGIRLSLRCKDSHSFGSRYDHTQIYESSYPDECVDEIMHGFYTCMIGSGWHSNTVLNAMKDYVEENLGGEFIKYEDESNENQD